MKSDGGLKSLIYKAAKGSDSQIEPRYDAQQIASGILIGYIQAAIVPKSRDTVLSAHTMSLIYSTIPTATKSKMKKANKNISEKYPQLAHSLDTLCEDADKLEVLGNKVLELAASAPRKSTDLGQKSWDYGLVKKVLRPYR